MKIFRLIAVLLAVNLSEALAQNSISNPSNTDSRLEQNDHLSKMKIVAADKKSQDDLSHSVQSGRLPTIVRSIGYPSLTHEQLPFSRQLELSLSRPSIFRKATKAPLPSVQQVLSPEGDYSAIPGEPNVDYPIYSEIPNTSFDCKEQEYQGYYADVEARCQVFHICVINKKFDFLCPNGTIFSQETLTCVWWNEFDCLSAPGLYSNNADLYQSSEDEQEDEQQDEQNISEVETIAPLNDHLQKPMQDQSQISQDTQIIAPNQLSINHQYPLSIPYIPAICLIGWTGLFCKPIIPQTFSSQNVPLVSQIPQHDSIGLQDSTSISGSNISNPAIISIHQSNSQGTSKPVASTTSKPTTMQIPSSVDQKPSAVQVPAINVNILRPSTSQIHKLAALVQSLCTLNRILSQGSYGQPYNPLAHIYSQGSVCLQNFNNIVPQSPYLNSIATHVFGPTRAPCMSQYSRPSVNQFAPLAPQICVQGSATQSIGGFTPSNLQNPFYNSLSIQNFSPSRPLFSQIG